MDSSLDSELNFQVNVFSNKRDYVVDIKKLSKFLHDSADNDDASL